MHTAIEEATSANEAQEKELFWRQHIALQKESGLYRTDYCRKHHLNYERFCYWQRKHQKSAAQLVPIKLKLAELSPVVNAASAVEPLLSTLTLKGGAVLKIHDNQALLLVLSALN